MEKRLEKPLKVFLLLVALHSFCVGLGLLLIPLEYYSIFGYENYQGDFFKVQAGVFHFVMCGAYVPAALYKTGRRTLVGFSIFAKFSATVFLLSYAFFVDLIWMVLASGIFDFALGLILLWFFRRGVIQPGSAHGSAQNR